jgi:hypothetical protein
MSDSKDHHEGGLFLDTSLRDFIIRFAFNYRSSPVFRKMKCRPGNYRCPSFCTSSQSEVSAISKYHFISQISLR